MLSSLFDQDISVDRLGAGDGNKKEYTEIIASVACHIQPVDESITQDITASFGKAWMVMCPIVDIDEGDRVHWNGEEYRVSGVIRHTMFGESHMEVTMRVFKS